MIHIFLSREEAEALRGVMEEVRQLVALAVFDKLEKIDNAEEEE